MEFERYEQAGILGVIIGVMLTLFCVALVFNSIEDEVFIHGERFVRVSAEQEEESYIRLKELLIDGGEIVEFEESDVCKNLIQGSEFFYKVTCPAANNSGCVGINDGEFVCSSGSLYSCYHSWCFKDMDAKKWKGV